MLTRRLQVLYDFVTPGHVAADIGTDHGYLIAELVATGRCPRGYACDVNPQPLEKARTWVEKQGLSHRIQLICCDGLAAVPVEQVEDVILAGMGGELIARILTDCPAVKRPGLGLVLQPMTKAPELRRWLARQGFAVVREAAVEENDFCYCVMRAEYTGEAHTLTELEARTGLISGLCDPQALAYLRRQRDQVRTVVEQTARSPRAAEEHRRQQALLEELEALLARQTVRAEAEAEKEDAGE